jgi:hypothetical protein
MTYLIGFLRGASVLSGADMILGYDDQFRLQEEDVVCRSFTAPTLRWVQSLDHELGPSAAGP